MPQCFANRLATFTVSPMVALPICWFSRFCYVRLQNSHCSGSLMVLLSFPSFLRSQRPLAAFGHLPIPSHTFANNHGGQRNGCSGYNDVHCPPYRTVSACSSSASCPRRAAL